MLSNPNYPKVLPPEHLQTPCLPASLSDMFLHMHIHRLISDQTLNMLGTRLSNFCVFSFHPYNYDTLYLYVTDKNPEA